MSVTTSDAADPLGYYATLNVPHGASHDAIQTVYRGLAKVWHPDVNPSPDAARRFAAMTQAWEVLSDPDRRAAYDRGDLGVGTATTAPPEPEATPPILDFGLVDPGGYRSLTLRISNKGGHCAQISFAPEIGPWFRVSEARAGSEQYLLEIDVTAEPVHGMGAGPHSDVISVYLDDCSVEVPIHVRVPASATPTYPDARSHTTTYAAGKKGTFILRFKVWQRYLLALVTGIVLPAALVGIGANSIDRTVQVLLVLAAAKLVVLTGMAAFGGGLGSSAPIAPWWSRWSAGTILVTGIASVVLAVGSIVIGAWLVLLALRLAAEAL